VPISQILLPINVSEEHTTRFANIMGRARQPLLGSAKFRFARSFNQLIE